MCTKVKVDLNLGLSYFDGYNDLFKSHYVNRDNGRRRQSVRNFAQMIHTYCKYALVVSERKNRFVFFLFVCFFFCAFFLFISKLRPFQAQIIFSEMATDLTEILGFSIFHI